MKRLILTQHAADSMIERELRTEWLDAAVRRPDWSEPDPDDPEVERRYRAIPERDGRVLRVACVEDEASIRVVTVFFDRRARRRK